jgi:XapX domain-containing protein
VKAYIISGAAGLLIGFIYSLMGVRSPAPPMIALIGLLGILLGEQVLPVAKHFTAGKSVTAFLRTRGAHHVLGKLPGNKDDGLA